MRRVMFISTFLCAWTAFGWSAERSVSVIPQPQELNLTNGQFDINSATVILADSAFSAEARYLETRMEAPAGLKLEIKSTTDRKKLQNVIILRESTDSSLGAEGYSLEITPAAVTVSAFAPAGVFYGIQTFLQLLPVEAFSSQKAAGVVWSAPGVKIRDIPRFPWRAYHLDDARWFHGEAEVLRLLDQMAALKLNVFHWYLTDDQGWRLEIKRYPKLTEVGAWRKDTQVGGWYSPDRAGKPHGGFYTQEQVRRIVQYAAERHIKVVPGINMPGHATAAIAAYPEMGASGRPTEVSQVFGILKQTFNVGDERVYTFLQNILNEAMELFPSKEIHLGGDEVVFEQWLASPDIKALMEREHLAGPAQVQLYFTNRMSRFLESRGRRMIGWNDILGDDIQGLLKSVGASSLVEQPAGEGLAPGTIVHFWLGDSAIIERAARQGHDIVNSQASKTYFDDTYEALPLAEAYSFDPVPDGLEQSLRPRILGLGCQMWSEWASSAARVECRTFPRLAALAEVGWTSPGRKNYASFCSRLDNMQARWDLQGIRYARCVR